MHLLELSFSDNSNESVVLNWTIKNCLNEWTNSFKLISSPLSVNDWVYNEKKNKNWILPNPIKCPTKNNTNDMEESRRQDWPV